MVESKTVAVDGMPIEYSFSEKTVHINNNDHLKSVIKNPKTAIKLAKVLRANYSNTFGHELAVSELSMAIEIYGHLFPEKMVSTLNTLPLPDPIKQSLDDVLKKTDVIDSGEESIDRNRKVWDAIAKVIPL